MATFKPPKKAAKPFLQPMMLTIHAAMRERKLTVTSLTKAMGLELRQVPAVYNWVAGKNAPNPEMRAKLAKVLDLDEAVLTSPLPPGSRGKPMAALGPAQRAVVLASAQAGPMLLVDPVRDVFSIVGRSDGQLSIRLQVVLDAQRGMALARFLMDFGLIVGDEEKAA